MLGSIQKFAAWERRIKEIESDIAELGASLDDKATSPMKRKDASYLLFFKCKTLLWLINGFVSGSVRVCTRCQEFKAMSEFYQIVRDTELRRYVCKACECARAKERHKIKREKGGEKKDE